jgi:hypothetical protein
MWTNFKVLSKELPGGTKRNHENVSQDSYVSWLRFEPSTSQIQAGSIMAFAGLLGFTMMKTSDFLERACSLKVINHALCLFCIVTHLGLYHESMLQCGV